MRCRSQEECRRAKHRGCLMGRHQTHASRHAAALLSVRVAGPLQTN